MQYKYKDCSIIGFPCFLVEFLASVTFMIREFSSFRENSYQLFTLRAKAFKRLQKLEKSTTKHHKKSIKKEFIEKSKD